MSFVPSHPDPYAIHLPWFLFSSTSDAISHLITIMCHANQVDRLTQFTFVGLQEVVERTLAFKARHSDPLAFPNYLLVLYSWHICRGDYRNGSSLLPPSQPIPTTKLMCVASIQLRPRCTSRLDALAKSMALSPRSDPDKPNHTFSPSTPSLSSTRSMPGWRLRFRQLIITCPRFVWSCLLSSRDKFRVAPVTDVSLLFVLQSRKRHKLTSHIPEDQYSSTARSREVEIIELEDIRREYNLVLSTLILADKFPESFQAGKSSLLCLLLTTTKKEPNSFL